MEDNEHFKRANFFPGLKATPGFWNEMEEYHSHRTRPTFQLIQNARNEVNPEEFFTVGDVNDDGRFYPERGDIIAIQGRTVLVLSTKQRNREMSSMTALDIKDGEVDYNTLCTIRYVRSMPELVEKAEALVIEKALKEVGRILE